ncbi:MAG: nucleoside-diphosphate-sugar epimerase [Halioglobus sp.]|jgi:nucleoside-diphosphate-sugar epimerase
MKPNSILIVGCGDIGIRTGAILSQHGYAMAGASRNPSKLPTEFEGYSADYCLQGGLDFLESAAPDYVITTFKPAGFSPEGYQLGFIGAVQNLLSGLGSHRPKLILMVSSTRVFAEQAGGWVDEMSPLADQGFAATAIVEAEQLLLASNHRCCLVRFGGIYGDPNGRLLNRIASGELCAEQPLQYGNRIHRDDCAGFIAHLLQMNENQWQPSYIGVDSDPAPRYETESWLAEQLGVDPKPLEQTVDGRGTGHKRCSNKGLLGSGYQLLYPGYRDGYRAVLDERT